MVVGGVLFESIHTLARVLDGLCNFKLTRLCTNRPDSFRLATEQGVKLGRILFLLSLPGILSASHRLHQEVCSQMRERNNHGIQVLSHTLLLFYFVKFEFEQFETNLKVKIISIIWIEIFLMGSSLSFITLLIFIRRWKFSNDFGKF